MNRRVSRRDVLRAAIAAPAAAGPLADLDAVATAAAIKRAESLEPRINAIVTEAYDRARAVAAE